MEFFDVLRWIDCIKSGSRTNSWERDKKRELSREAAIFICFLSPNPDCFLNLFLFVRLRRVERISNLCPSLHYAPRDRYQRSPELAEIASVPIDYRYSPKDGPCATKPHYFQSNRHCITPHISNHPFITLLICTVSTVPLFSTSIGASLVEGLKEL